MATVAETIEAIAERFAGAGLVFGHGFESAWDEAVALVLAVTGLPDDRSVLDHPVDRQQRARIDALAARRTGERIPLAYLIGRCRFAGHEFLIEPGVVVPRSPIGALIEARFSPWLRREPERILDLCCGSGCIGIAAALAFPAAQVDLADIDAHAVALTRRNMAMHGIEARARVFRSDLFDALPAGRWDLILSNPPYVDRRDMAALPAEHRHEPAHGLAGGDDGLALIDRMITALPERLEDRGTFVCEVGASAPALLARYPYLPFVWPDLPNGGEGVFLLEPQRSGGG
ncbi:MAG TPA: 50S ribosomal protein L3 N(5)-glutamine methyltransferase [Pseudomonadales bacterium]